MMRIGRVSSLIRAIELETAPFESRSITIVSTSVSLAKRYMPTVDFTGVHERHAFASGTDHGCLGLCHLRKVGGKATVGDKGAGAHDGQVGMDHLERLHGEGAIQIAMALAQRPSQHDDIDRRHTLVDIIGDGNVGRDNGNAVALIEESDELERCGARVYEQRVAVIDELDGALRDGLLGGDVDIDSAILRGDGQAFVE